MLLALSLATTAVAAPRASDEPELLTEPGTVFTTDSYPQQAWDAGEEGIVAITLVIGSQGLVSDCAITRSSQSALLDAATCRIAQEKLRFDPARDEAGQGLEKTYKLKVHWQITPTPMKPSVDRVVVSLEYGFAVKCANPDAPSKPVENCNSQTSAEELSRAFGNAFTKIRKLEIQTIYQPGRETVRRPVVSGRRVILTEVVFGLDANGSVIDCKPRAGFADTNLRMCIAPDFRNRRYSGASDFVFAMDMIADLPPIAK